MKIIYNLVEFLTKIFKPAIMRFLVEILINFYKEMRLELTKRNLLKEEEKLLEENQKMEIIEKNKIDNKKEEKNDVFKNN